MPQIMGLDLWRCPTVGETDGRKDGRRTDWRTGGQFCHQKDGLGPGFCNL